MISVRQKTTKSNQTITLALFAGFGAAMFSDIDNIHKYNKELPFHFGISNKRNKRKTRKGLKIDLTTIL